MHTEFSRKAERKRALGKSSHMCKYNIKMNRAQCVIVDWLRKGTSGKLWEWLWNFMLHGVWEISSWAVQLVNFKRHSTSLSCYLKAPGSEITQYNISGSKGFVWRVPWFRHSIPSSKAEPENSNMPVAEWHADHWSRQLLCWLAAAALLTSVASVTQRDLIRIPVIPVRLMKTDPFKAVIMSG
jgi:hypothetical protein